MKFKGSPITAAVAALALAVGGLSFASAILVQKKADHEVCVVHRNTNAAARGLLDDFLSQSKPPATLSQRLTVETLVLKRYPVITC